MDLKLLLGATGVSKLHSSRDSGDSGVPDSLEWCAYVYDGKQDGI